jgi:acylphosphatase
MPVRKRVVVAGRVQGVAFRNSTQMAAVGLGVTGWVRNLPNGDVEGCFEGEEAAVQQLVDWCRRGPSAARVDRLIEHEESYSGEFCRFEIRY